MKPHTITTIVLAGIVAFSFAACSKSEAPKTKGESLTPKILERTEPSKPPQPQQPTVPPLEQEALALAEKRLSEKWTQVGDSWFTWFSWKENDYEFFQIRGVTHQVKPDGLSEADTLNGWQWKGWVTFDCSVHRQLDSAKGPQWSDWSDGRPTIGNWSKPVLYGNRLTKKNGQWEIDVEGDLTNIKPSEEQIKKILPQ